MFLADVDLRVFIPPIIYRLNRCNNDDEDALNNFISFYFDLFNINSTTNVSNIVLQNIILSEMWDGLDPTDPGPSLQKLLNESESYYFTPYISVDLAMWWPLWNKYIPNDEVYALFANPPIPMLLFNGDLDPQTPIDFGLHSADEYGCNIDDNIVNPDNNKWFYTFPNTPHAAVLTSPITNTSDYEYETCGLQMIKSFIMESNGSYIPNGNCVNWIKPIDFEGTTDTTQQYSLLIFGTEDIWQIDDGSNDAETEIIVIIFVGIFIILIEMALCMYWDYRKQLNSNDDMENQALLTDNNKKVPYSERL